MGIIISFINALSCSLNLLFMVVVYFFFWLQEFSTSQGDKTKGELISPLPNSHTCHIPFVPSCLQQWEHHTTETIPSTMTATLMGHVIDLFYKFFVSLSVIHAQYCMLDIVTLSSYRFIHPIHNPFLGLPRVLSLGIIDSWMILTYLPCLFLITWPYHGRMACSTLSVSSYLLTHEFLPYFVHVK